MCPRPAAPVARGPGLGPGPPSRTMAPPPRRGQRGPGRRSRGPWRGRVGRPPRLTRYGQRELTARLHSPASSWIRPIRVPAMRLGSHVASTTRWVRLPAAFRVRDPYRASGVAEDGRAVPSVSVLPPGQGHPGPRGPSRTDAKPVPVTPSLHAVARGADGVGPALLEDEVHRAPGGRDHPRTGADAHRARERRLDRGRHGARRLHRSMERLRVPVRPGPPEGDRVAPFGQRDARQRPESRAPGRSSDRRRRGRACR